MGNFATEPDKFSVSGINSGSAESIFNNIQSQTKEKLGSAMG